MSPAKTSDERASRLYRLLNDEIVRECVVSEAAKRYRYRPDQVQLWLYVGRFSGGAGLASTSNEFARGQRSSTRVRPHNTVG